jgi:hypothetical protein
MDLLHLVDRLEELVAGAQKMPIGNRAILDRRRMLDLIDQMRIAVPHEVREAQDIVAQRDAIRREAEEEGRIIVAQAEERAAELIEEHSITEGARGRAEEIAAEAERRLLAQVDAANQDIERRIQESRRIASEQMAAADEYARELLQRLDRQLQAFQNSVRSGIQQLEPQAASFAAALPPLDDRLDDRLDDPRSTYADIDDDDEFTYADDPDDDDGELEDLLRRSRAVEEAPPGVIDDFENEPLDDDQVLRPAPRERD